MGVRGVSLADGDSVISLAILRAVRRDERGARRLSEDAPRDGRRDRRGGERRRGRGRRRGEPNGDAALTPERYAEMSAAEQSILTVSENGFGKRTSSFEYRLDRARRQGHRRDGGQRHATASWSPRSRSKHGDEIMLVTDGGQLIRCPVDGIRVAGRATQGVIVFDTAEQERVVSVERISEPDGEEDEAEG